MKYEKEIFAQYDKQCIRVYQAYNPMIAKEAITLQTFGEAFHINRMTWIKPSFLWLMYRSNWGTKKNQECIRDQPSSNPTRIKRKYIERFFRYRNM